MKLIIGILLVIGWNIPKATYYYPVSGALTASGEIVIADSVLSGNSRWIAISRDLSNSLNYGDTVIIESQECPGLNGLWKVNDLMGPRWKKKIDFLLHPDMIQDIRFNRPIKVRMTKKR